MAQQEMRAKSGRLSKRSIFQKVCRGLLPHRFTTTHNTMLSQVTTLLYQCLKCRLLGQSCHKFDNLIKFDTSC